MSDWYRNRSMPYKPGQKTPFKVSRSKIELFMQCRRCFWLDVRLKISRPSGPPFQINKAIDELLKKEFDTYRHKGETHPLMSDFDINAVPMQHQELEHWRHNFTGVSTIYQPTNMHVFGAIDDLWISPKGEAIVVDYKATAKQSDVTLDADWQITYKRQIEIYQWLLRHNGLRVSNTGYFVYANAKLDNDGFFNRVEFKTKIIPYEGSDEWVEGTLNEMKKCMDDDKMPAVGVSVMGGECEFCEYARARAQLTLKADRARRHK